MVESRAIRKRLLTDCVAACPAVADHDIGST
jgi:hypothetical protein